MQEITQKRPYPIRSHALRMPDSPCKLLRLSVNDDDVASTIVPPVTVVLEGRSICHRVHLSRHTGYDSLAVALRCLFVGDMDDKPVEKPSEGLDLSNAVPGHVVAYEDMEDDLLLAGDLSWRDFVRVVKRIRIIPVKASRRRYIVGEV
ncbi:auxin-responsive protein IAA33-like protein [Carex littledalei]|uniref:Auxin-responsive protein n=1 Tax=Carex littledalei TaxID=544730 RepID=A0A833RCH5_9POAL|nr:auxin-responsive protein IAA33-like protein [Carex littledalei]